MVRDETNYRLGHFILIERNGVMLSWMTHSPFGGQHSGRCYILGNILVLLPCDLKQPGYLKLEFHEYLIKLPQWTKTTYYCFATSLLRSGIHQSLSSEEIKHIANNKVSHETFNLADPGAYQLNRYKITINNLAISWQTIDGSNKMIDGSCYIESDIIFLGPQKTQSDDGRRRPFFTEIKLLPSWNKTAAWGYAESLRICDELKNNKPSSFAPWNSEPEKSFSPDDLTFLQSEKINVEGCKKNIEPGCDWFKIMGTRIVEWKIWIQLATLAGACWLICLRICRRIAEKHRRRAAL
ncbi:MAG: hypothetical protein KJ630_09335 [Proteobacteria bacterium]|nr:hypothetical protein [Pseudomonadota bacterium]